MADECSGIAADDTYNEVHAAALTFATHDTIGNVAYKNACEIGQAVKSAMCSNISLFFRIKTILSGLNNTHVGHSLLAEVHTIV